MYSKFNYAKNILLMLAFSLTLIGCTNETALDYEESLIQSSSVDGHELSADKGTQLHFNASLKGANAIPWNDSKAAGEVIVKINKKETVIHFKLITANIKNVSAAHFHMAEAGQNGGVVVPLYGGAPNGPNNGVLSEGYITAENVVGGIEGDLDALIAAIRAGMIYANVHTTANPGGEIRGQL